LGESYILTHNNPVGHLKEYKSQNEPLTKTILNLEDFVEDLGNALNRFCQQLKSDAQIRGNALHSLQQIFIIGKGDFEFNHTKGSYFDFPNP